MNGHRPFLKCAIGVLFILSTAISAGAQTVAVNGQAPPNGVTVGAATGVAIAVSDGPGNTTDWIALYPVGASDDGPLSWSYLSGTDTPPASGLTSATVTTYAPLTPGEYEWRLFATNDWPWTRVATSGVVTVTASTAVLTVNGVAAPSQASVGAGDSITVSLAGGPGNPTDLIRLAPAGSPNSSSLDWRYLNDTTVPPTTGVSSGTVQFLAPSTAGTYELRLFAHGSADRIATAAVNVSTSTAVITVDEIAPPNAVSVVAGTYVTVRIAGGPAQPGDRVGLFAANAVDSANLGWRYLNGTTTLPSNGISDAQLIFAVPVTAGSYEFRFFSENSFTRLATSTTMVVSASSAALSVNGVAAPASATAAAGSQAVVSVDGGPANVGDVVRLYPVGAPDAAALDWRYLNDTAELPATGLSTSSLHFGVPTTAGTYELRFFAEGGGVLASSGHLVVLQTVAHISVNGVAPPTAVSVPPGSTLAVEISGGPANPTDWVALAAQGAPHASVVAWQYLNGSSVPPSAGLSGATLSFVLPSAAGTYEVRLFAHNSHERITTSSAITASTGPPQVTVSMTSPFPGTTFNAPSGVLVSASASITGGTISRVDFYAGSTLIGSASAPPYETNWSSPPQGLHLLTAAVVDATNIVTTSAPIAIAIASSGASAGTLGAPIANPAGGFYGLGQPITLTASPGATIRYTTDGNAPDETSAVYSAALTLTQLMTVRARASQLGWTESEVATAIYQIDTAPPTIVATITPAPNPAGWNNTPVTVSFECIDSSTVATCPAPVVVTQEGAGLLVTVSAVDAVGLEGNLTVTINIDSTPPVVSLTAPIADVSTTDATLAVSGSANDLGSGVVKAVCNGQLVDPTGGPLSCTVSLASGRNTVIVAATDLAGNSASAGFRATRATPPTALSITPTTLALGVGDANVLSVTTDAGLPATGLTWVSSDPSVLAIAPDNDGTITAEAVGEATVTASAGGLTAQATVRVWPNGVALGEAIWTAAPTPGRYLQGAMRANPIADDDPDLFTVEGDAEGSTFLVKAIRGADGATLWSESVGDRPIPDAFGGFMVKGEGGPMFGSPEFPATTLRRIGNGGIAPWEYLSAAWIDKVASAPDGTVYFTEYVPTSPIPVSPRFGGYNIQAYIVGLDGRTGTVRFRVPMPTSSWRLPDRLPFPVEGCPVVNQNIREGGSFGPISVLENGDAVVQHQVRHLRWTTECPGETAGTASDSFLLRQWRVTAQGAVTSHILAGWSESWPAAPNGSYNNVGQEMFFEGENRPDGRGGVLASWYRTSYDENDTLIDEPRMTQISSAGLLTVRPAPSQGSDIMVTSPGTIYLPEGPNGELMARDTDSWAARWPTPVPGTPVQGGADGGVLLLTSDENGSPLLQERDSAGTIGQTHPTVIYNSIVILPNQGVLHGVDLTGNLVMVKVPVMTHAEMTFLAGALDKCKVTKLNADVFPTRHKGLVPDRATPYLYRFEDAPPDSPPNVRWRANVKVNSFQVGDQKEGVREAFQLWSETSWLKNLGYLFEEAEAGEEPDIIVRKGPEPVGIAGSFESLPLLPDRRVTGGTITFSIDENFLLTQKGYFKVGLHEIGHALGLAHPWAPSEKKSKDFPLNRGKTVMNSMGYNEPQSSSTPFVQKADDPGNNIPLVPTACDVIGVRVAKTK